MQSQISEQRLRAMTKTHAPNPVTKPPRTPSSALLCTDDGNVHQTHDTSVISTDDETQLRSYVDIADTYAEA